MAGWEALHQQVGTGGRTNKLKYGYSSASAWHTRGRLACPSQVPYSALEIAAQREKYRVLREGLGALVSDYNQVGTVDASNVESDAMIYNGQRD